MSVDLGLSELPFWTLPQARRLDAFRRLRQLDKPVYFEEPRVPWVGKGTGFHALVRHADVVEASRNAEVFSSEPCANSVMDLPNWLAVYFGSMINMDNPRHARLRRIVSRAFTPRIIAKMEEDLAKAAVEIVDNAAAAGSGDFVDMAAARLPVRVICDMMGIPGKWHDYVLQRTNVILGYTDAEYTGLDPALSRWKVASALVKLVRAGHQLNRLGAGLAGERRAEPTGDLTSLLVNGEERLSPQELGSFFILLVVAGSETTRNAISHGLKLFTDHPEQRELLLGDFDKHIAGALEEIVRFCSPVMQFRRTLTRDHEMNGVQYRKGEKVVMYYISANRDEAVFDDPDRFDITRDPNPQIGYGGPGPHYCLGAHLARREMTVMFRELFTRMPGIRAAGKPDYLVSNFINGIKRLPYSAS
ncbi:cytochrome P450 [Nonomuraea sp. NPDC050536]|uniref:cytochrome P450 n=1 Tax=Nonomuraea sp. NPDC050536 TaxID=3364366 RepID=UPI0037CA9B81